MGKLLIRNRTSESGMARVIPEDSGSALILPLEELYFSFAQADGKRPRAGVFRVESAS
jgi:hypothetical protein